MSKHVEEREYSKRYEKQTKQIRKSGKYGSQVRGRKKDEKSKKLHLLPEEEKFWKQKLMFV